MKLVVFNSRRHMQAAGDSRLKIIELRAENFKRIQAITIRPDGSLVLLTGKNDQGKTSALQSIATALRGKIESGPTPIRDGAEQAKIKLDLGELVIHRYFTKSDDGQAITTKLTITNADGSRVQNSPQGILDALIGDLTFSPLAFGKMPPKAQFDALRSLVRGFDFVAHDRAQAADYSARTEENRKARDNDAAAAKITLPPGDKPEPIVIADILAKIDEAQRFNQELSVRVQRRKSASDLIDAKRDEAESLRARAVSLEREADELEAKLIAAEPLPSPIDQDTIAAFKRKLSEAESINAIGRAHEARAELEVKAAEAKAKSDALTTAMELRETAKKEALAATAMPFPGMDLRDGAVFLDGIPFTECGTAKRIKASMAIAMALNPKLKIVMIDEGSELDADSMKTIAEMAEGAGYQVWATSCHHDSGRAEIVIEDGEVVG